MAYLDFFQALSSQLKLNIVVTLRTKELSVSELAKKLGEERSTVSHALQPLLDCGFVTVRQEGRERIYTTNTDTITPLLSIIDRHMHTYCKYCSGEQTTMIDPHSTVAQIVTQDYRTAPVFKKFNMDFCCGGKKPLLEACKEKNVDLNEIQKALNEATTSKTKPHDYDEWDVRFLTDYIVNTHHAYIRKATTQLPPFLEKVVRVHGSKHPELREIQETYNKLSHELLEHIQKEEETYFPTIKAAAAGKEIAGSHAELVMHLEDDHEQAGKYLQRLRTLTNNYLPPEGACNTYKVTFALLEELETDLHLHVHLENNILFPKAVELLESPAKCAVNCQE